MLAALAQRVEVISLVENRRQPDPEERFISAALREGRTDLAVRRLDEHGHVTVAHNSDELRDQMVLDWWSHRTAGVDVVMGAVRRSDARDLNARAHDPGSRRGSGEPVAVVDDSRFCVGDRVIGLKNRYDLGVLNGDLGEVTGADETGLHVRLDAGRGVALPLDYVTERLSRGATWLDDDGVVWLCAVRRREEGSDDDAFEWFAELHRNCRLLPTDDDRLRDQSEEAVRVFRRLRADLFGLVDRARAARGTEHTSDLDHWLPSRSLVYVSDGVKEIWCVISVRAADGNFIRPEMRDLLFAALEEHLEPAIFEARSDWPTADVDWFEAVRLGMR